MASRTAPAPRSPARLAARTLQGRKSRSDELDRIDFDDLLAAAPADARKELSIGIRCALLDLPALRDQHNDPPTPAEVVTELESVHRRITAAIARLRPLSVVDILEPTIKHLEREIEGYSAMRRPGKRKTSDRGLQVLAQGIDEHLRAFHFGHLAERERYQLVLRILHRAGINETPDLERSTKQLRAFFHPSSVL